MFSNAENVRYKPCKQVFFFSSANQDTGIHFNQLKSNLILFSRIKSHFYHMTA